VAAQESGVTAQAKLLPLRREEQFQGHPSGCLIQRFAAPHRLMFTTEMRRGSGAPVPHAAVKA
jgi:hypothetical protein